MHHPRSNSDARRLRFASLLLLINRLMIPLAIGLLVFALLTDDRRLMIYGLVAAGISLVLVVAQWMTASHAGCPLCRTPVLSSIACMKHRKAKRMLGSYKLRVALAILILDRFRCPYCNESTSMEVKERLSGSRPRGTQVNRLSGFY